VKGLKGGRDVARKCIHLNEKSLVDGKPFCYTLGHACVGPEYCGWYSPKPYNKDGKEEEECSDKRSSFQLWQLP